MASSAHLFVPRDAYRFRPITPPSVPYDDPTMGEDPEYGASLSYWLKEPARATPTLTIVDAAGDTVRTLQGTNRAGVNRVHWDLEDEPTREVRLLTSPIYAEHIQAGPEGRAAPGAGRLSILMPPGAYTVTLAVDGVERSQPLTVLKDPHSGGTEAEIAEQVALLRRLEADMERAAGAVQRIEALRVQLGTLARFTEDAEVKSGAQALAAELVELEMAFLDLRLTGEGQDGVRFEARLIQKLGYLAGGLAGADFRPTDQQVEVQGLLAGQVRDRLAELDALVEGGLATLNQTLRAKGLTIIADGGT
jgi:hypothetical protein